MQLTERRNRFRSILSGSRCLPLASVFDAISARIADFLGYEVGMLTGGTATAAVLGVPDLVLLTLTELAEQIRRITRATNLSLMVDADHGYGNALTVMRTVEELETAGVCALTIEDSEMPPPFGIVVAEHDERMISVEEMVGKLRAAVEARQDPSLVIVGRTSAVRFAGVDEAIRRVKAYEATGIDCIRLERVRRREELEEVYKVATLPLLLGQVPEDMWDWDFLAANGVRIVSQGSLPFQAAVKAVYDTLKHLKEGGSAAAIQDRLIPAEQLRQFTRSDDYARWQREFLS